MLRALFALAEKLRPLLMKLLPIELLRAAKRKLISRCVRQAEEFQLEPFDPKAGIAGVNLIGCIRAETGLGQSCRLVAGALDASGLPFGIYNYQQVSGIRKEEHSWDDKISDNTPYNVNLFHINPYEVPLAVTMLKPTLWKGRYNIAFWLWELEEFPSEWTFALKCFHEIWTPSEFSSESIRRVTDKPVLAMPYYLTAPTDSALTRSRFGLPEDIFLFLTMYDTGSTMERKNPMGAVRAFKRAFSPEDSGVGLVVKLNNPSKKDLQILRQELSGYKNIWLLPEIYTKIETNSLISLVDAMISLHRAEGFGLAPAEAMLLGTPVISTNWSSTTEFMDNESACLVDYQLVPIAEDIGPYKKGQRWADPDLKQAAGFMRHLYEEPKYRAQLAENAKRRVKTLLGKEQASEKIVRRLAEIGLARKSA